ncbi:hypothetical protein GGS23DRAFT_249741 [Durotheca rogersii]|uniref:uncharacterized protein n=1 Tax=Durotheca rogersii TaxID=419775 RepID=UPI00221F3CDC|nr:uncharacterized protein GGS23DRAFT_249741 [Durotheca rogersii]KAI5860117.1 hypothetical protein GGS23DRAFT_249741 [Durotheca rogersii]
MSASLGALVVSWTFCVLETLERRTRLRWGGGGGRDGRCCGCGDAPCGRLARCLVKGAGIIYPRDQGRSKKLGRRARVGGWCVYIHCTRCLRIGGPFGPRHGARFPRLGRGRIEKA